MHTEISSMAARPSAPRAPHVAWIVAIITALVLPSWALPAAAQDTSAPPDMPDGAEGAASEMAGSATGDLGFGQLGEDFFLTVYLATSFAIGKLSIGVQAPLRIRIIDKDPQNEGTIREEDWDEISDYLRVIRFVQWSQPGDTFYARVGELSGATIGHGTVMSNYLNVVDIDHFQLGVDTEVNLAMGGGEFVLDNVVSPEIFSMRGYLRPWFYVDPEAYLNNWSVGASLTMDTTAPSAIQIDPTTGEPAVDDANNLEFDTEGVSIVGVDTDFTVLRNEVVSITPYIDVNTIMAQETGVGAHFGVLTFLHLPMDTGLDLRLEAQALGEGYAPQYVDTLYELQRGVFPSPSAYPAGVTPLTKQEVIGARDEAVLGYLGELGVNLLGLVRVVGLYRGSEREFDNDLLLQLVLPKVAKLQMGVVYSKSGFEKLSDAFDPEGALFQAYARMNVMPFVDVIAQFNRTWHLNTDETSEDYGTYETVDEWNAGVGLSLQF